MDASRPRLRLRSPALAVWRSPDVLQVGLDPPAVVLAGVPGQLAEALALLAHPNSADELARLLPDLGRPWIDWLIERLRTAGLLVPSATTPQPAIAVVGGGALAAAVASAAAGAAVSVSAAEPVALAAGWSTGAGPAGPELVVLAASTAEPDRTLTDALQSAGRPHLVVRLEPDRAVVGPLVLPGRTPCVRCQDLSRCHLDPAWPRLLAQLCREPVEPNPALLGWAATTAAIQLRGWLAGAVPQTCGSSLELWLADFGLHARPWPAHPRCGCLVPIG